MAYQFVDSFDHYNTAFLAALGMYETVSGSPLISSAYARFPAVGSYPNQGLYIPTSAAVIKNLKSNQSSLIVFAGIGAQALPGGSNVGSLIYLNGGPLTCVTAAGAIQFYNPYGDTLTPIGPPSANGLIAPSSVPNHGLEFEVVICPHGSSTGSIQCWLDGDIVIPLTTGLDTGSSSSGVATQIQLGAAGFGSSSNGLYFDYIRVWDNTGTYQNAPLGLDRRKLSKLATGPGDLAQFTPNGAASNWQCVDDNPPDGDTTYVASNGNNYDSYAMGSSGLGTAPSMVVAKSLVRKDDSATRSIQIGVRSSGQNGLGVPYTVGSTYVFTDACISVDPATGLPPTAAAADAFQHVKYESA